MENIREELNSLMDFTLTTFDVFWSIFENEKKVLGDGHGQENLIVIYKNNGEGYEISLAPSKNEIDSDILSKFITKHLGVHFVPKWVKENKKLFIKIMI